MSRRGRHLMLGVLGALVIVLLTSCDPPPKPFASDDFSDGYLGSRWTVVDPAGDGTVALTGLNTEDARLELGVPAGVNHEPWTTNQSLRAMQTIASGDFGIEAKFDSVPSAAYQEQGLLVEEDADSYIRFDVHHDGANLRAFAATIDNGTPSIVADVVVPTGTSLWTRVTRSGDQWTFETSTDGSNWSERASFAWNLAQKKAGVFAGNFGPGTTAPAWTALVDYVFNTASPIAPEDPIGVRHQITRNVVGQGAVFIGPDLPSYADGEPVLLVAVADPGWAFQDWSGDASGTNPVLEVVPTSDLTLTATFVEVPDTDPPVISAVGAGDLTATTATISWATDEPATSSVAYGPTTAYENGSVASGAFDTSHSLDLSGLTPDTTYHYRVSSVDPSNNSAIDVDRTFTTGPAAPALIVSDDFSSGALGPQWNEIDPLGDGTVSLSGVGTADARVNLSVPGGVNHEPWVPNNALQLVQDVTDEDLGVEVKFDSVPSVAYQEQGILVKQDDDDYLRFEFHHNGTSLKAFAARIVGGTPTAIANVTVPSGPSLWARVVRTGDQWDFQTSINGTSWTTRSSFVQALAPASVGVFAGNYASGSAPAWTAEVDYVFDMNAPIVPEDPVGPPVDLTTTVVGSGSVQRVPDQVTYSTGQQVELAAVPAPGWAFDGWSGDLISSDNPLTLTLTGDTDLIATFISQPDNDPPVITDVTVEDLSPISATISWSTDELADAYVDFGPTTAYENGTTGNAGYGLAHNVDLIGLTPDTTYHYQVSSTDPSNNLATDIDRTFTTPPASTSGPTIDLWYGNEQTFGSPGLAQRWANIVGRATDPNGVAAMSYRLNGGPAVPMGIGPDGRRLVNPGDFNVDLLTASLQVGSNTVQIDALDGVGDLSSVNVTVNYQPGSPWPLPYAPDLAAASAPAEVGQVVDGHWGIAGAQLSTVDADIGYDRLVAIGDSSWTDYEATFTMRVNALADPTGPASGQPAAGFLLRWSGHNTSGGGHQPQIGVVPNSTGEPTPFGAYGLWRNSVTGGGRLELRDHYSVIQNTDSSFDLTLGQTYEVRARVVTDPGTGDSTYSYSVWPEGTPEPASWNVEFVAGTSSAEPASGSFVLLAHEADVDFAQITVNPIAAPPASALDQFVRLTAAVDDNPAPAPAPQPTAPASTSTTTTTTSPPPATTSMTVTAVPATTSATTGSMARRLIRSPLGR